MAKMDYDEPKFSRGANSLVAVNPERITTLMELAKEHYGEHCGRCRRSFTNKRKPVVHHRHYRTVGFEKPAEDIVLLCRDCHQDLHDRSQAHQLNNADIPFVDPEWEPMLRNR